MANQAMTAYDSLEITSDGYILHDDSSDEEEIIIEDVDQSLVPDLGTCVYCSSQLLKVEGEDIEDDRLLRKYSLWYCRNCRFWQSLLYYDPYGGCMPGPDNWAYVSKMREFDADLPDTCNAELASWIRRNSGFFHSCNPRQFEKLVADVFRANFADAEVLHVGKPDDGGVDVLLIDTNSQQWLVQVKRRESPHRSEGVKTIRDVLGAMVLGESLTGIVVSTANQFSLRAKQAVAKAGQVGVTVKLIDKGILNRMLDPILPDRPWLEPISQLDKELALRLAGEIHSDHQLDLFSVKRFRL